MSQRPERRRKKNACISSSRWAAYATAGTATVLGCAVTAEANIMYSGSVDQVFNASPGHYVRLSFDLTPSAFLVFSHRRSANVPGSGLAHGSVWAQRVAAGLAAAKNVSSGRYDRNYASKLSLGQNLSAQKFYFQAADCSCGGSGFFVASASLAYHRGRPNSQWAAPGTGFFGFAFDTGEGTQYGWARIRMDGAPGNSFTLVDYAFADPGERIRAGQTTESVPESGGSLGLLALGCAGLLAWRAARQRVGNL